MQDITLCKGEDCPLKRNCYRFTSSFIYGDETRNYFRAIPYDSFEEICQHYLEVESK